MVDRNHRNFGLYQLLYFFCKEVDAGNYRIRSTEENVYLNETAVDASTPYQFTVESGKTYRIVTQSGTEAPYITVIKGK